MHPSDCLCCREHGKAKGSDGLDAAERKCVEDVQRYGLHIWQIAPSDDDDGFSYSVGLFDRYHHPEIIVFGQKTAWQGAMLNAIADRIRDGERFQEKQLYADLIDGFMCRFQAVRSLESYRDYLGWNLWYYLGFKKNDELFPVMQFIWPDKHGVFPSEHGYNSYRQPILP